MTRRLDATAGAVAALAVVVLALVGRLLLGIPLPFEDVSDRFLPLVPVSEFLTLLSLTGGALMSKMIAFFGSFIGVVGLGALLGIGYGKLAGNRSPRAALTMLGGVAVLVWVVAVVVLFPALDANYQGRRLSAATWFSALGLLALFALFVVGLAGARAALAPSATSGGVRGGAAHDVRGGAAHDDDGKRIDRGALIVRGAGGLLGLLSAGLIAELYRRSAFGYDGMVNLGESLPGITPNERFYVVTKNFVDPRVHDSHWRFEVTGLVEHPRLYDLAELQALPAVDQEMTLECISNSVGGGLLSNARWRGVRLRDLIHAAGIKDGAGWASFGAPDGFTHSVPLARAMVPEALIAYEMNGARLPDRHGYPARILIPGVYGEVNAKWVERMELSSSEHQGYYESQGWKAYHVHTMSRIDSPAKGRSVPRGQPATIRGVAFAGDRGVSRVEVSTDGGQSWRKATLDYHRSHVTWALWSIRWRPATVGTAELVVRATDGTGAVQAARIHSSNPSGASGLHRVRVTVA